MTIDKTTALLIIAAAKKEAEAAVIAAMPKLDKVIALKVSDKVAQSEIKAFAHVAQTIKGDPGQDGKGGVDGKDGKDGRDGVDGKDGLDGKDGTDGRDGIDGKDGSNGLNGKDGKTGPKGKDGTGIDDVAIGDDGHLYVGLTDGRIIDAGIAKGKDGKDGKDATSKVVIAGGGGGSSSGQATAQETFETVNKNLKAYDATMSYGVDGLETVTYSNGIIKTLAYSPSGLQSVTLSGNTPSGISLIKTFVYSGGNLTGFIYS